MKHRRALIGCLCCLLALAACGPQTALLTDPPPTGLYLTRDATGPYLFLSDVDGDWHASPNVAMSFAFTGKWVWRDGRLYLTRRQGEEPWLVLDRPTADTLRLVERTGAVPEGQPAAWLRPGLIFTLDAPVPDTLADAVCPADEGLALARGQGAVVIEDGVCTSGEEVWQAFVADETRRGRVTVAQYYTLDRDRVSPELYAAEKDDYPRLFLLTLTRDNGAYGVTVRKSDVKTPESTESYACLLHLPTDLPPGAAHAHADRWVLTDDPDVTWEQIEAGIFSSAAFAGVRHRLVFSHYTD